MKLLGSIKSKITENENDKNAPYLEITEAVLVHCNIVNSNYQQNSRVLYTSILRYFIQKYYIFENIWFKIFIYWSVAYWSKF